MFSLVDTHSHLDEIEDLDGVLRRAEEAGIASIVAVGSDFKSNRRVLEISGTHNRCVIYAALGFHPWNMSASCTDTTLNFIADNIHKVVAIGEVGLDFWLKGARKDPQEKAIQKEVFQRLLDVGREYEKPVIIHSRGAWEECYRLVSEMQVKKAVFHWYSGPLEILEKILCSGYVISATPAAQYSEHHQMAISRTPMENILLETDSPVKYQGKRSEPSDLMLVVEAVAKIKGITREEVAEITAKNSEEFFNLKQSDAAESGC